MINDGEGLLSKDGTGSAVLTRADLIAEVSRITELPLKEAGILIEHILDSMVRAIERGDKVEIRGFGSFRTRLRGRRIGRNPKTGAQVEVPARKVPVFKPSKELRALVMKL